MQREMIPIALLALWTLIGAVPSPAQQPAQPAFPSAAEATKNLFLAVQSNNEEAIAKILGGPTELTSSRDKGQDQVERELFVEKYQEMHRLRREADRSVTLYLGAENWPFPIPIVEKNNAWRFDADAGMKEVMLRRIGENELMAIALCHEFVAGERQSRSKSNTANPVDGSPAMFVAKVLDESAGGDPVLYRGYYFRELPAGRATGASRGFGMIAYPAEYRSSGVMTFIVTNNGVVYEKDLGPNTASLAIVMTGFHKEASWRAAGE